MSRNEHVTNEMVDAALDFANLHWKTNKFCRAMLLTFRAKGNLSDKQVLKLLEIKAGFLRSRSRHYQCCDFG